MKRLNRARDKELMVQTLTTGESRLFDEIWQLLLFAAAVGYRHGRREKLGDVDSGKAINPNLLDKSPAGPGFQYLLTLVTDGSAEHLSDSEQNDEARVTLFEEYANGGLALLMEALEKSSYSLDAMIRFLDTDQPDVRDGKLSDIRLL